MRGSVSRFRGAAGALLAIVILAMSSVPASAFVTHTVLDVVADFSGGTFQRTGLISNPAEGVEGVQLMPIGLTGQWVTDTRRLPIALQELTAATWGDFLFVIGGRRADGSASSRVFCVRLNEDGSVAAISDGLASLPKGLIGASSFVMEIGGQPYLYVLGGLEFGTVISRNVYRTDIDPDTGKTGVWVDLTGAGLPFGMYYSALATSGPHVYLIGGIAYGGAFATVPNVFRASVNELSGDLTPWTNLIGPGGMPSELPASFSSGVAASQALVYAGETYDTIYLMGGRSQATDQYQSALTAVAVAHIDENGNLSAWQEPGLNLPVSLHGHGAVMVNGSELLLAGGRTNINDPNAGIQSNVKAALVDPGNPTFPLVDWDPAPDEWNVWQTGVPFPNNEMRAYHGMVQVGQWVYALGGSNASNTATDTIFRGSIAGVGALYAPSGSYESPAMTLYDGTDPGLAPDILRLEWDVTLPFDDGGTPLGTVDLEYSWRAVGGTWTEWAPMLASSSGANSAPFVPALENAAQFRFRADFTSVAPHQRTPRVDSVRLVYDAAPPDMAVNSLTASKGHVRPGDTLTYTAAYQNVGGVGAEAVGVTLTLPPYLSSLSPEWTETEPGSHVYIYSVGQVKAGAGGTAKITVRTGQIPEDATSLEATATASFPAMTDLDGNSAVDPNPANDSTTATVSATPLAVVGTVSSTPVSGANVSPNDLIEYRLSFVLEGGTGTSGLTISAPLDTTKLVGITPLDGGLLEGSTARWYYAGTVPADFQTTVRLQAQVRRPLANGTQVGVTFSASSNDLPVGTLGSTVHTVVAQPQLTLQSVAEPAAGSAVTPGQTVTYRFTALNNGDEPASGTVLTVTLAPGLSPVSSEPSATIADRTVTWNLGTFEVDSPRELKMTARVDDNTVRDQTVSAVAQLAAVAPTAATTELGHTVRIPAHLTVQKTVEPTQGAVSPGGLLTYKLVISNMGGEDSGLVAVTDRLPAYTTDVDGLAQNSVINRQLANVAPSQSIELTYRVQVMDPLSESVKTITGLAATATALGVTTHSGITATAVSHFPNLWVALSDGKTTVKPGDVLTYTVDYGNRGGPTVGVALQVTLSDGLEWRGGDGWQSDGQGHYRLLVDALNTETRQAGFQAAVAAGVPVDDPMLGLTADCSIAGAGADADPYDNADTDIDIVNGPDLAVLAVQISPTNPVSNQYLSLRVVVGNVGAEGARQYAAVSGLEEVSVEVYIRPSVSAPPSGPVDSLGGYCPDVGCGSPRPAFRQAVPVDDLMPGSVVTLNFPSISQLSNVGLLDVYAQVDVGGTTEYGGIREGNEVNNLLSLRRIAVADPGPEAGSYHLPLVGNNAVGQ